MKKIIIYFGILIIGIMIGLSRRNTIFITEKSDKQIYEKDYYKIIDIYTGVYKSYFEIWSKDEFEPRQAFYYRVRTGCGIETPLSFFMSLDSGYSDLSFDTITAEAGHLVGLTFSSDKKKILLIHDFSNHEDWPRPGYTEKHPSTLLRGQKLMQRLKKENINIKIIE